MAVLMSKLRMIRDESNLSCKFVFTIPKDLRSMPPPSQLSCPTLHVPIGDTLCCGVSSTPSPGSFGSQVAPENLCFAKYEEDSLRTKATCSKIA